MSSTYIPAELRRRVVERAESLCEYCLIGEAETFFGCEVDHIVSEKHGGATEEGNLALACLICNRKKGSDIGSVVPGTERLVRFFNPRSDRWAEHFTFDQDDFAIRPIGDIGIVTEQILRFNDPERLAERKALYEVGRYPSPAARRRMNR
ncbi:MAG: HNH endonuclease [Gemmatimonadetes bacterium]|nr:HNH endonuclease [Gemmatimonadota bacterium]